MNARTMVRLARARAALGRFAYASAFAVAMFAVASPAFAQDRASFSGSFTVVLAASPERALPLFDPVGEAAWAPGWKPVFARASDRASLPNGTVFTTRSHGGRTTTWLLQRYDRAAGEIAYTVFTPDETVVSIHITVRARPPDSSEAVVRYDVVAVSAAGDAFVRDFAASFPHMQPHWQHALDDAVARRR